MFEKTESNIVYKMKNKDVFFLIEHQSTIDYLMPIRILRYEIEIIEQAIKGKKMMGKDYKFPTVIPIVLYTGTRKWNVKKYIQECQVVTLGAKNMKFGEYNIVDVNDYTNDELEKKEEKDMVIEVLQKENERQRNIGIKQGLIETAKKMLKRNMNMDDIQDITGLTKNELEKLKK